MSNLPSTASPLSHTSATLVRQVEAPLKINHLRWPCGLELLHVPDHGAPVVSYQTWIKVGSGNEEPGHTGLAHLFEHLMFKGTELHPEGEFDRILEELGGEVNAATWLDWTYYYVDLPSAFIERVIELESDRISNLVLTAERLEAERQVVINERQECVDDDPCERLSERLWSELMGKGHPYAHSTIGLMSDIKSLSLTDCQRFYENHYHLGCVTLVVCGDVKLERLTRLIESRYEGLNRASDRHMRGLDFPPISSQMGRSVVEELEIHAPRLHMGFKAYPANDPKSVALECLDELLFEGDSSRLYKKLIFDLEIASCVYSVMPQFRGESVYEVVVELLPGEDYERAASLILEELELIVQNGVQESEIERVKLAKELQSYRGLQTVQQRAFSLGFWQTTGDDYQQSYLRLNALQTVTISDVQAVAAELLKPNQRLSVIGMPHSHEKLD